MHRGERRNTAGDEHIQSKFIKELSKGSLTGLNQTLASSSSFSLSQQKKLFRIPLKNKQKCLHRLIAKKNHVALFFVHFHLLEDSVPIHNQEPLSLHLHLLSLLPQTQPFHLPLLSTSKPTITTIIITITIITTLITVQLHLHVSIYTPQTLVLLVSGFQSIHGLFHQTGRFQTMLLLPRIVQFRLRKRRVCVRQRIIPVRFDAVFTRTTETTAAATLIRILQLVSTCVDLR